MYLAEIVSYVNATIRSSLSGRRFEHSKYVGIAQQVERDSDGKKFVVIFDNDGVDVANFFTDQNAVVVYHRLLSTSFSGKAQSDKDTFGDGSPVKSLTARMQMVVFADRKRLELTSEQLFSLMYYLFPQTVPVSVRRPLTGLVSANIIPTSCDNNVVSVGRSEGFEVTDTSIFFSIQYNIELTIDTACLEHCDLMAMCMGTIKISPVVMVRGIDSVTTTTTANQNTYYFGELKNKVKANIVGVLFDNMPLRSAQYSLASGNFTITDTAFPVEAGQELTILFK